MTMQTMVLLTTDGITAAPSNKLAIKRSRESLAYAEVHYHPALLSKNCMRSLLKIAALMKLAKQCGRSAKWRFVIRPFENMLFTNKGSVRELCKILSKDSFQDSRCLRHCCLRLNGQQLESRVFSDVRSSVHIDPSSHIRKI